MKSNLKYSRAMWFTGQELHISTVDKDNLQLFHTVGVMLLVVVFLVILGYRSSPFRKYSMSFVQSFFHLCQLIDDLKMR